MISGTRTTPGIVSRTMVDGLESNLDRLQRLQEQISSGKLVNRPSDSPVAAVASMQIRSDRSRTTQHSRNADDGRGWLNTADTALTSSLSNIGRVRELLGQSLSGAISPEARQAIAQEVDSLRSGVIDLANTRYLGRAVFAGTANTDKAYDPSSGSYLGDDGAVERTIAPGAKVQVNTTGPSAFGLETDPDRLFKVLSDIVNDLNTNNDAGLNADLSRLDKATSTVASALGAVGARYNRVESMQNAAASKLVTLADQLSAAEDIDLPRTIMELQLQQTAYQAALGSTAKVIQPSLLDFLR
jgi:flagellar hook-associated protein 3 FlgL